METEAPKTPGAGDSAPAETPQQGHEDLSRVIVVQTDQVDGEMTMTMKLEMTHKVDYGYIEVEDFEGNYDLYEIHKDNLIRMAEEVLDFYGNGSEARDPAELDEMDTFLDNS